MVEDKYWLEPQLREGMVVMDVGANIGYLTLYFCKAVGSGGAVFAFEPEPNNFEELARTVEHNHIQWCTTINCACGPSDQEACVATGLNGYIQRDLIALPNCRMVSLDSFVNQQRISKVDFVKIDVEGFEADVLEGMSGILKQHRPVLYLEVHPAGFCGSGDPPKVCSLLKRYYQNIQAFRILGEVKQGMPVLEKIQAAFRTEDVVRRGCETSLDEVMASTKHRYQLLALP